MKKLLFVFVATLMLLVVVSVVASAKVGDVVGHTRYTDIIASINNHNIASFNIDGNTGIVAEDLKNYGFNVQWVPESKSLYITRASTNTITSTYTSPEVSPSMLGQIAEEILYTDIKCYINGSFKDSYNVNGQTIINFNDLACFGSVTYDNNTRQLNLDITDGLAYKNTNFNDMGIKTTYIETEDNSEKQNNDVSQQTVSYKETLDVYLGNELITQGIGFTLGDGWSGNVTDGFTHTKGSTSELKIATVTDNNSLYLLEFDTTVSNTEFVTVGFGKMYKILCYKGSTHCTVPLKSDGGELFFCPLDTFSGTISNISLKKIQQTGTLKTLDYKVTATSNHTNNYGFWNTMLGAHTMQEAVGSTRSVAIGYAVLKALEGGHRNIGIGTFVLSQMKGGEMNVAMGSDSMLAVKNANSNVALGSGAMYNGKELSSNVAVGKDAMFGSTESTAKNNTIIGASAGFNTRSSGNVFVGFQAGYRVRTGSSNIIIGNNAFGSSTGDKNIVIGRGASFEDGISNSIVIGANVSSTKSNQIKIGDNTVEEVIIGDKKINFNADGTVTWQYVN